MYLNVLIGLLSTGLSFFEIPSDTLINGIDNLYAKIAARKPINKEEILGRFEYVSTHVRQGEYIASFSSVSEAAPIIKYFSYSDDRHADFFLWNSQKIQVKHKFDLTLIRIYKIKSKGGSYTVFVAKSQSASGSGVQVTYFIINKLTKDGKIYRSYELESRFGNINSLIEISDKEIGYYKVVNGNKMNKFLLTINSVETDRQVIDGNAIIEYELNDRFVILSNNLLIKR